MRKSLLISLLCFACFVAGAQNTVSVKNSTDNVIQIRFIAYDANKELIGFSNVVELPAMTDKVCSTTTEGLWPKELPAGAQIEAASASAPCNMGAFVGNASTVFPTNVSFDCDDYAVSDDINWIYSGHGAATLSVSHTQAGNDLAIQNN